MKAWSLAVLTVAGLGLAAGAQPKPPSAPADLLPPPARIESHLPDRGAPVWVSAEQAIDERGGVATELFAPLERTLLQQQLSGERSRRRAGLLGSPGDPCRGATGMFAEYYVDHPGLGDLVTYSEVAFSGTVRGSRPGFYRGQPRHLYRVEVDEVWLDVGNLHPGTTVFVAFEEAQIRVGDDWLCVRGPRYPARPMPGKRILVFSHHGPWGDQPVFSPMDVELFFEAKDGLSVPGHLVAQLESPSWNDLEATVAGLVAGSGAER
jgi:hypothetical protein